MNREELKGKTFEEIEEFVVSLGEPRFRAKQLFSWIYAKGIHDFESMTDMGKGLREKLREKSKIFHLERVEHKASGNGDTEKFLFQLRDGNLIESVLMRYEEQKSGRCTVCISSQVGCAQGCVFCASGQKGFVRNLSTAEIVDQVSRIQEHLNRSSERIHNVVIMGIGEPLLNYDNVVRSIHLLNDERGLAIGIRRLALSTVGIPQYIRKFAEEDLGIRFAVSLHAPDDELRSKLMPVNRRYPLADLMDSCRYYQERTGKRITFEYMLIEGMNDDLSHADKLAKLLKGIRAMINLIPYNPVGHFPHRPPTRKRSEAFARILEQHGYKAPLRNERGVSIDAACGQLRARRMECGF